MNQPLTYTAEEMSQVVAQKLSEYSNGNSIEFEKRILILTDTFGKLYPPEVKGTFSMAQLTHFETAVLATLQKQFSGFPEALKALAEKVSREVPEIVITGAPRAPQDTSPKEPRGKSKGDPIPPQDTSPKEPRASQDTSPKAPRVNSDTDPKAEAPAIANQGQPPKPVEGGKGQPAKPVEGGKGQPDQGQGRLAELEKELRALKQELGERDKQLLAIKQELGDKGGLIKVLRKDLGDLRSEINNLKKGEGTASAEDEGQKRSSQLERRLSEITKRLSAIEEGGGAKEGKAALGLSPEEKAHLAAIHGILSELPPDFLAQLRNGIKLLLILDTKHSGEWRKFRSNIADEVGKMVVESNEFRDRIEDTIKAIHQYVKTVFPLYR